MEKDLYEKVIKAVTYFNLLSVIRRFIPVLEHVFSSSTPKISESLSITNFFVMILVSV